MGQRTGLYQEQILENKNYQSNSKLNVLFTNADVLTSHRMQELKLYLTEFEPDLITISEVKQKKIVHSEVYIR